MARIVITGASGFVGRAAASAAQAAGHTVIALGRRAAEDLTDAPAASAYHALDLGTPDAAEKLAPILTETDAVIHAAAAMAGDDATHARETLAPTRAVLAAIEAVEKPIRLVLVSSFSVYGFAAMPEGAPLSELTPLESAPYKRDAYTRAKLEQETLAVAAARSTGLDLWLIRPGTIYGVGRLDTARLGIPIGTRRFSPGGNPKIPAVDVAQVGAGLVATATVPKPQDRAASGPLRQPATIINLTDRNLPRQSDWAKVTGVAIFSLPKSLVFKAAAGLDLVADLAPSVGTRLPNALLPPTLAARFKDLRYSSERAEDILGLHSDTSSAERLAEYKVQHS